MPAPAAPSNTAVTLTVCTALLAIGAALALPPWLIVGLMIAAGVGVRALRRPRRPDTPEVRARLDAPERPAPQKRAARPRAPRADGDVLVAEIGKGLAGVVIGQSTVADVLATFGLDCMCHCYDNGDLPGPKVAAAPERYPRIWLVSYDYDERHEYHASRRENERRPSSIEIDSATGRVKRLDIGVYQRAIRTREGLAPDSDLADMLALYGDDYTMEAGEDLDFYKYPAGIEVWIARDSHEVNSFKLHAPRA